LDNWTKDAIFYHIYPLGLLGAPEHHNADHLTHRLPELREWAPHLRNLGVNALYLGPLFQSSTHGYDTVDYFQVDRRLGDADDLRDLVSHFHAHGIRVVLDAVFNHVSREFPAFQGVREEGARSPHADWFQGMRFDSPNSLGDPFSYDAWNGHLELPALNLKNQRVKEHLLQAVEMWIREFDIDGLRLDAADCVDSDFQKELRHFTTTRKADFWLLGEIIHGDYRAWANPETLHSVTNYECYKGLYSSLNDSNYHEMAWSLNRQFGPEGIYRGLRLYNFADNHDVNRVASTLAQPSHLYPLYVLLFSMPGIPSLYYGSEWGYPGVKAQESDAPLRPRLRLVDARAGAPQPDLEAVIRRLARIRQEREALKSGVYRQLSVAHEQFAFLRQTSDEAAVILLNASDKPVKLNVDLPLPDGVLTDQLEEGSSFQVDNGRLAAVEVPPQWGRILTSR